MAAPDSTPASLVCLEQIFEFELGAGQRERCTEFVALLRDWSRRVNLAGPALLADPYPHLFEAFWACRTGLVARGPLLDIGSGAGFPGLAIAIERPAQSICLLEPHTKKALFLMKAARQLGLSIRVEQLRYQELKDWEPFEQATLRGLRPETDLLDSLQSAGLPWLWFRGGDEEISLPGFRMEQQRLLPGSQKRWITSLRPRRSCST